MLKMSSKLKFCANLTTMYVKETSSLIQRYSLAKESGFKAVECAFPYDIPKGTIHKLRRPKGTD